ncbi:MAG: condensation domain-containing protein, partial [Acidobacteriota bacterium]
MNDTIEGFRLSPQQARLWSLQEKDGSGSYRARAVVAIDGRVDPDRLRLAIVKVAGRHEILRTTFRGLPGMSAPLQVIGEVPSVAFEVETRASEMGALFSGPDLDLSEG